MSSPLFMGSIQLSVCSIDTATIASRGSPFVWKSVSPRNGIRVKMQINANRRKSKALELIFIVLLFNQIRNNN